MSCGVGRVWRRPAGQSDAFALGRGWCESGYCDGRGRDLPHSGVFSDCRSTSVQSLSDRVENVISAAEPWPAASAGKPPRATGRPCAATGRRIAGRSDADAAGRRRARHGITGLLAAVTRAEPVSSPLAACGPDGRDAVASRPHTH